MNTHIIGLGQWLPPVVRTNDEWPREFLDAASKRAGDRTIVNVPHGNRGDLCDQVVARYIEAEADDPFSGATRRRIASDDTTSYDAEIWAAKAAIADAAIDPMDIDMV